jgi:pimeloyl-ACP methyl ester carboxylesterase
MHGGLSDTRVFAPLSAELAGEYGLWAYDRRGHGRTPDTDAPLGFESMLAEAVAVVEQLVGPPVHLVGHSDGASLALLIAARRPDLVASVSAFSGNLDPSGMMPGELTVQQLVDAVRDDYEAVAPDAAHLPVVAAKILTLWFSEPTMTTDDIAGIRCPTLIAAGEHDSIRAEHTASIAAAIPGAALHIATGEGHMFIEQRPAASARLVRETIGRATAQ